MKQERSNFNMNMLTFNMDVLTEEEKMNVNLIKDRKDFKENPVPIYFGSKKEGLDDVCETCSKSDICRIYKNILNTRHRILSSLRDESFIKEMKEENNFTDKQIEKIKNDVYMAINCIFKE